MPTTDQPTAQLDRILTMTPDELAAEIRAEGGDPVQMAAQTRKVIDLALRQAAHDRGDWMVWRPEEAIVLDGCHYQADLDDGRLGVEIVASVWAADEVGFYELDSPDELDVCPERLRWLGF